MKILISAYACEPAEGSEPGVGWNWAVQAALHGHDVLVITRANNREVIEREMKQSRVPKLSFHYFDLPRLFLIFKKRCGYFGFYSYYYLWQVGVCFVARRLYSRAPFDLVHHVTFVNDWMPSGLAGVRAPFVWGPVGGSTHEVPSKLRGILGWRSRRYELMRRSFQKALRRFDPMLALTRHRASIILTYTEEALEGIPARHRWKARSIVHIGVSESDVPTEQNPSTPASPFTIVSGGRLVHWKGFDLLLEGFANFVMSTGVDARLVLTGDGPFRKTLEVLVEERGICDYVQFLGKLPSRSDVYRTITRCHLYAQPTLRDGPPTAILEAMLAGKPVLCLDLGATRELVPDFAGFKISVENEAQIIRDIAQSLAWAQRHPSEINQMGLKGREYALTAHHWRRIGDEVDSIYESISGQRDPVEQRLPGDNARSSGRFPG